MIDVKANLGIEDFLASLDFIIPDGVDLDYILLGNDEDYISSSDFSNLADRAGFVQEELDMNVKGVTDTKIYKRKVRDNIMPAPIEIPVVEHSDAEIEEAKKLKMFTNLLTASMKSVLGTEIKNLGLVTKQEMEELFQTYNQCQGDSLDSENVDFLNSSEILEDISLTDNEEQALEPISNLSVPNSDTIEVIDSDEDSLSLQLNENFGGFPKHTVFKCSKKRG